MERLEKVETTLLKEFHKWAQITETRIRVNETLPCGRVAFPISCRLDYIGPPSGGPVREAC